MREIKNRTAVSSSFFIEFLFFEFPFFVVQHFYRQQFFVVQQFYLQKLCRMSLVKENTGNTNLRQEHKSST